MEAPLLKQNDDITCNVKNRPVSIFSSSEEIESLSTMLNRRMKAHARYTSRHIRFVQKGTKKRKFHKKG